MSRERMKKGIWILCAVLVLGILCEFLANLPALLSPARNQAKQIPLSSVTGISYHIRYRSPYSPEVNSFS